jgi:hypothetical protein
VERTKVEGRLGKPERHPERLSPRPRIDVSEPYRIKRNGELTLLARGAERGIQA